MLTSRTGTEIEELEKEVARLQEELRVANNRIEELTGQFRNSGDKGMTTNTEAREQVTVEELILEGRRVDVEKWNVQQQAEELAADLHQANKRIKELEETLVYALGRLQSELFEAESRIEELQSNLEDANDTMENLRESLDNAYISLEQLQEDLETAGEKIEDLEYKVKEESRAV